MDEEIYDFDVVIDLVETKGSRTSWERSQLTVYAADEAEARKIIAEEFPGATIFSIKQLPLDA
jgi:hypothetical protein